MTAPRTLLKAWQTPPKKQFGQNFLCDPSTPRMIVSRANVSEDHVVLEIGAGLGALTIPLAQAARKVIAVEKDQRLHALLNTELALHGIDNVHLIAGDILSVDISAVAKAENTRLHVFGNLPYNISSQILVQLIAHRRHVARCVLMFQKELAERLRAEPGNKAYGRISVMLQYCAAVSPVATLEAHLFYPSQASTRK